MLPLILHQTGTLVLLVMMNNLGVSSSQIAKPQLLRYVYNVNSMIK
jgi:hypothetical protein